MQFRDPMRRKGTNREPAVTSVPPVRLLFPPETAEYREKRVLLVGTGPLAMEAVRDARGRPGTRVAGAVDSDPEPEWGTSNAGVPVWGGVDAVERVVAERCIDEIRVALTPPDAGAVQEVEAAARRSGVPVYRYAAVGARAKVTPLCPQHGSIRGWRYAVKRGLDVVVAAGVLVALSPLLVLIAIAIKLTSPGPVLFHQPRIGLRRRQFRMLKFRTMLKNAEALRERVQEKNNARGISFKIFDDPRVTRVGAILRRSSLDELPQLLNVLFGEMTLVGPRPIPVWVAEQMEGAAYLRRFSVKQGLTGLWQVEGRQQDFNHMATQDVRYVDEWSLLLDTKILCRTLPAVIRGEGAH